MMIHEMIKIVLMNLIIAIIASMLNTYVVHLVKHVCIYAGFLRRLPKVDLIILEGEKMSARMSVLTSVHI